ETSMMRNITCAISSLTERELYDIIMNLRICRMTCMNYHRHSFDCITLPNRPFHSPLTSGFRTTLETRNRSVSSLIVVTKSKILPIGWDFILLQIMDMNIRTEVDKDFKAVFDVIKNAFENEAYSDHQEHYLVERLRKSDAFVPELSLVAEINNEIVGYILLTKIKIIDVNANSYDSLALAPVAVLPNFQGKGIGRKLIETAHEKAKDLGFSS